MSIRTYISSLMGKHKMSMSQLAGLTGIDPHTISRLYYEEARRIEISHISALCKALDCQVSDIFEYVED